MEKNIIVKVFSLEKGMEEYNDVTAIRIKSEDYNLLIMKDYMPIIGQINGSIQIEGIDINETINNIKGYYINYDNVFNIIIEE